jgi:predicted secreted hydrolase
MNLKNHLLKVTILIISFCVIDCCSELERPLNFPFDHGPHCGSLNEWWYFTGEALTTEGKTLGFEFTIFKRWVGGLKGFVYLGHLAVSNPEIVEHYFAEVPTLHPIPDIKAGKTEITINNFSYSFSESEGIVLQAEAGKLSVNLSLTPTMAVLPHGQDGIIVMGDGINSYYYSFTNLMTEGSISVNDFEYVVSSGRTWMDHQWGNYTVLGMIWDWFSLRLNDGSALMLFQFRDSFDNVVKRNWTYRPENGAIKYGEDFYLEAASFYDEENGKSIYPLDWIVEVPDIDAHFVVTPLFDEQSLYDVITPDYWEGLCSVEGTITNQKIDGSAYVELTGY